MTRDKRREQLVKVANRQFYDAVANRYEEIDGRRSPSLEAWLRKNLSAIRRGVPGGHLLDIGTGSGLVTRCSVGLFASRVGLDLSPRILAANLKAFDAGVAADVDNLPFADNSFDVVTCFAVLHHLYDFLGMAGEMARVLKPGGVFYSDHDIDAEFCRRFRLLLAFYRWWRNSGSRYAGASEGVTQELHDLAEWQGNGVDSLAFVRLLEQAGFAVEAKFHWFGLVPVLDKLLGTNNYGRGWAPLLSVVAIKDGGASE